MIFVISGVTDLFFDLFFMAYSFRRFLLGRDWKPLTLDRLEALEQQRIAIFIAAWQESDVIAKTLINACETIQYKNYDIFVGTYPNDPATQAEVDRVAKLNDHVHKVVTPENGPTNKASNLNHVFKALEENELQTGKYYDIIVMHDSEDVIHPHSLLVYNYLIPRMDMIQIPVFPIALPLNKITHWTYADEFAENHTKNLLVREIAGGFIPSAGVGTAFTKRSFMMLAIQNPGGVFSTDTLTEDYQLGSRMNLNGFRSAFVNVNLKNHDKKENNLSDWVATRAVFPTNLKSAVRQKTRWNIGIIFQGWQNLGWEGTWPVKWNLFQDRKALIASPINFLAYIIFIYSLLYIILARLSTISMPVLIPYGSPLWYLVLISTIFMVWRAINRAYAVNKIYGFLPALTSIPRVIWGNLINFIAVTRAVYQYTIINRFYKRQVAWDKTAHEFPEEINTEFQHRSHSQDQTGMEERSGQQTEKELQEIVKQYKKQIAAGNKSEKVRMIQSIPSQHGELLFPVIIHLIEDPAWEVRAAVCRTLGFLRLPQSLPFLIKAAADPDWIVRANATRALGKLGDIGEAALLHILLGEDRYASEAALAILENQGFLQRHIENLNHPEKAKRESAAAFIRQLAKSGKSKLANALIEKNEFESKQEIKEEKKDQRRVKKLRLKLNNHYPKKSIKLTSKRDLFLQKIRGNQKKSNQ